MYHPKGFSDSEKFVIKGSFFYYNSPGNSYLNKFISGLTLEEKFENDDIYNYSREFYLSLNKNMSSYIVTKPISQNCYDDSVYNYEYNFKKAMKERKNETKNNKNNKNPKKRQKNIKKNKIRQNGYDDKQYFINQQIIKPIDQLDEKDLEIEEHYLFNLNCDRKKPNDSEYDFDLQEEFDRQEECAIEWFRDNCY